MIDETLECRVRTLEEKAEGEKTVTRHVLEQSIRNGDVLHALRSEVASFRLDLHALTSRVDHIAGDVVQGNAALTSHGRRLNTLTQDVGELRQEMNEMSRRLEQRMDSQAQRMDSLEQNVIAAIRRRTHPARPATMKRLLHSPPRKWGGE